MNKKKIIYITIIITILTCALSTIAFAKYYNNNKGTVVEKIAKPIINLSKENDDNETITASSGVKIVLNVSNYNDEAISEVGQNYYLQFYSDEADISKFNITVTMGERKIQVKNGITENVFIQANQKEIHKYNVEITSNTTESIKGTIQAKIVSEQVEPK